MSLFNTIVRPHELSAGLLAMIAWGDHPVLLSHPYPLLGRVRYVWLSEDYQTVKVLLKDGPNSWSEQKEEIMAQIKGHETFKKVEVLERDPVYLVAEFGFLSVERYTELAGEEHLDTILDLIEGLPEIDKKLQEQGEQPVTKHPFDIFDEQIKLQGELPKGVLINKEVSDVVEKITKAVEDSDGKGVKIIEI